MDAVLQFSPRVGMTYATPLFWNGPDAYEAPTSRTLAVLISLSQVFLDVGSNVGIYAVYAGVKYSGLVTYAFEPVLAIWEKNRSFHRANRLDDQTVLNMAVGDRIGAQQLLLPVYDTGVEEEQSATLQADSWQSNHDHLEKIEVQCITLDHFAATHSLPEGFCCVKIDVEGHEAAVLRGGRQFIQMRRPWIVCEVLPGQKTDAVTGKRMNDNGDVVSLIEEFGYSAFALTGDGCFRMNRKDFLQARQTKDFLLIPTEFVHFDLCYLTQELLAQLIAGCDAHRM